MSIILFVGPSGSGKTTLSKICEEFGIPELVSTTTREKRNGEMDGVNYHFISESDFDVRNFVETSSYAGNMYGITKEELETKLSINSSVYAVVDVQGMMKFKEMYKDCYSIFVSVTPELMVERMRERGDKEENIVKRLQHCIENNEFDNAKLCDFTVTNNELTYAQVQVRKIIQLVSK